MRANVGFYDRVARVIVGAALLSLAVLLEGNARWFGLVGLAPLLTAAVGFCPLYALVGIDTCALGGGRRRAAR